MTTNNTSLPSRKLTVLFAPAQGMGHIGACHGMADTLRGRGYRCVFAMDVQFEGQLARHGFEEQILQRQGRGADDYSATEVELLNKFFTDNPDVFFKCTVIDVVKMFPAMFGQMFVSQQKLEASYQAIVDRVKPDVIVADTHIGSPAIHRSGLPWVYLNSSGPLEIMRGQSLPPAFSGLSINDSSDKWDEFRRETVNVFEDLHRDVDHWYHGLTGEHLPVDSLQPFSPYLNIYMTPKELDYTPIAKPLPGYNWLRVDGFVRHTHETFTIPESLRNRPGKLFLFALGSLLTQNVTLMRHVTGILAKSPHKFIVSAGPQHDKYQLPANMWGQPFLPQTTVLPLVDGVITHGGNNSVTEAFYFGKPVLIMPVDGDQFDNAQRLVDTGLGYRVSGAFRCTESELLPVVDSMANNPVLAQTMKRIGERIRSANDGEAVALAIERIAQQLKC